MGRELEHSFTCKSKKKYINMLKMLSKHIKDLRLHIAEEVDSIQT